MGKRMDRVDELMKREISAIIMRDYEFRNCLITVNAVETTQDLKEGKVFISVLGGNPKPVLSKLNGDHGAIQSKVMKRVVLKNTPVLRFLTDDSVERGVDVVNLLDEVDKLPKAPAEEELDEG